MSKQIRSGVKAVMIDSGVNNGVIVDVVSYAGLKKYKDETTYHSWEIDGCQYVKFSPECKLNRIDDDEQTTTWQSIEQLTNWNPEKVNA